MWVYTLNASKASKAFWRTETHTRHSPSKMETYGGRKINGHWSRHAFRDIPKAQYTFKSLLVHGILQFTMLITLRCALHRCSSRDIRRWKLWIKWEAANRHRHRWQNKLPKNGSFTEKEDGPMLIHYPRAMHQDAIISIPTQSSQKKVHDDSFGCVWMILPQVHLRKPCYDFSFL